MLYTCKKIKCMMKNDCVFFCQRYIQETALCSETGTVTNLVETMLKKIQAKVTDHTTALYGKNVPPSLTEAKNAVLHALCSQVDKVESVTFLENFNQNLCETAVAGALRCSGLAVILDSSYQLQSADAVWLNGLYGETTSVYPMASDGVRKMLPPKLVKPQDSTMVCGVYEKPGFDPVTGSSNVQCFTIVNASANKLSRALVHNWVSTGMQIREAYEDAATKKLKGKMLDNSKRVFDNLSEFTKDRNAKLASEFGAIEACYTQTSNTFMRGKSGSVVYLNGALTTSRNVMTHVSPLHGFVEFPATSSRQFYPSNLLSHDYVNVVSLNTAQRDSIYSRAKWAADTTVNGYALRQPIAEWTKALPQPCSFYRMRFANFGHDERESAAIPTSQILQMTPTRDHVEKSEAKHVYPKHVKNDLVRLQANDLSVAKLLALRDQYSILNEEIYDGKYLNLSRELAEKLV